MHSFIQEHSIKDNVKMVFHISEKEEDIIPSYLQDQFGSRYIDELHLNQLKLCGTQERMKNINILKEGKEPRHVTSLVFWE